MSEPMKKHRTGDLLNFTWRGTRYAVPMKQLAKYEMPDDCLTIEEVFGDDIEKYGEPALLLRGVRAREGFSQGEFAAILGISQQNLSAMENGRRTIGREMAKRIGKRFDIDYRRLL